MSTGEAALIFPHQLFIDQPSLKKGRLIVLVEDPLFYGDFRYPLPIHKQKLLLQRAAMTAYSERLAALGMKFRLVTYQKGKDVTALCLHDLAEEGKRTLFVTDPVDWALSRRLEKSCSEAGLNLQILPTPAFLCTPEELEPTRSGKLSLTSFYRIQRKKRGILLQDNGKPLGGKWSFDPANRRRLSRKVHIPPVNFCPSGENVRAAARSVNRDFPDNPGSTEGFAWPVTHEESRQLLADFVENRLSHFGDYEDAMSDASPFLFHSALSSSLNIGLLTPQEVLDAALAQQGKVPINSLEGFIRQVMGWREFMRLVYLRLGVTMRTSNFWDHRRPLPKGFWSGTTGILPVDETLRKVKRFAYGHHIERLMVLGNFLLLCETDPTEIYRWFMSFFIDAYDWVMVPNVYAMSQFTGGGLITTKPYFCASGYILRMSHWEKGPWCDLLDGLFWRFVRLHRGYLRKNARLGPMTANLDRMAPDRLKALLDGAESYLEG